MSLGITWCSLAEAESKFGLPQIEILKMVENGLVRSEKGEDKVVRINIDDLKLKVEERAGF